MTKELMGFARDDGGKISQVLEMQREICENWEIHGGKIQTEFIDSWIYAGTLRKWQYFGDIIPFFVFLSMMEKMNLLMNK